MNGGHHGEPGHHETVLAGGGLDPGEVPFPDDYPERRAPLTVGQLRIGRRSVGAWTAITIVAGGR